MWFCLLITGVVVTGNASAQLERAVPTPDNATLPKDEFGPKFFDELGRIFGRLHGANVHHAFQVSRPIQCSDLVNMKSKWRHVAFFSGKQGDRDWYRINRDEVRTDLATYIFEGDCRSKTATLQLATTVPVDESVRAYQQGKIQLSEIHVKVNPPVKASFNGGSRTYTFELPYLFRGKDENGGAIYTFYPRSLSDRYVTHITSRWECKALDAEDATYRFLICHTILLGHDPIDIKPDMRDKSHISFGTSAYSILSDGKARADY
jgi:hypothetical protein